MLQLRRALPLPCITTLLESLFIHFSCLQRMMGESMKMGKSVHRVPLVC